MNSRPGSNSHLKLCVFPGGRAHIGPIHTRRCLIRCQACGNTEVFVGRALVYPRIMVERMAHHQYEVVEISYQSTPNTDEIVERCAVCGSAGIEVIPIRVGTDSTSGQGASKKPLSFLTPGDDPPF